MTKRIRVSDADFVVAIKAVKEAIEAGDKSDPMELLADESGLTPDSARQRVYKLIRAPEMVKEVKKNGKEVEVNKGGWGVPREKVEFLFNSGSQGQGNKKDADKVRELYLAGL